MQVYVCAYFAWPYTAIRINTGHHVRHRTTRLVFQICCTITIGSCAGLAGLGTNDEEMFEDVKNILYTDSAVGVACAVARCLLWGVAKEHMT